MTNRLSSIICLLVFAGAGRGYAQTQPSKADPDKSPVVEVVGCLAQTGTAWTLANASDPAVTATSFTTPEEVKAAGEKALGTQQYRLLGTSPFGPDGHKGHKMVVRGLLTKSGTDTRINLTSFQMLGETCAK